MNDGARTAQQYDAMATDYSADNDEGVFNSLYERPAMLRLLGDPNGQSVLDLGCGAGQLSDHLIARGAAVTGIDVSAAMIDIAKDRLGDEPDRAAEFVVGDISEPLPFEPDSFDIVAASLVMHYIEDWVPMLQELKRVLKPAGFFVFSTHHPTMDWLRINPDDYFAKKQLTETWTKGGREFDVTFWRRPLSVMSDEIRAGGFMIDTLVEPMPEASLAEANAANNDYLTTNPHFLFARLIPAASD